MNSVILCQIHRPEMVDRKSASVALFPDSFFARANGPPGRPAAELLDAKRNLSVYTYYIAPGPPGALQEDTMENVLENWDELVDDLALEEIAGGRVQFAVIFSGREGVWRSVFMTADEFKDRDRVYQLLTEHNPTSDVTYRLVTMIQIEEIRHPDFRLRPVGRGSSFSLGRILASRPHQTKAWYSKQKAAQKLIPIENKNNKRCLEYAIAIHMEERKIYDAFTDPDKPHDNPDTEKRIRDMIKDKKSKSKQRKVFQNYIKSWGQTSRMSKDAKNLAILVWGDDFDKHDPLPRNLDDLHIYHNVLNTRFLVLSYNENGTVCKQVYSSSEDKRAHKLRHNSPLVTLLWTPPKPPDTEGHFDLIPERHNIAFDYLGQSRNYRFCQACLQTYYVCDKKPHTCIEVVVKGKVSKAVGGRCFDCGQWNCDGANLSKAGGERKQCDDCGLVFSSKDCFENHKLLLPSPADRFMPQSITDALAGNKPKPLLRPAHHLTKKGKVSACDKWFKCKCSNTRIERVVLNKFCTPPTSHAHQCYHFICKHCFEYTRKDHACLVRKHVLRAPGDPDRYVCMDIEADPRGDHKPYLIRVSVGLGTKEHHGVLGGYDEKQTWVGATPEGNYDEKGNQVWFWFEGEDCGKKFVNWCLEKRKNDKKGFTVLAYNGSNYDYAVLYPDIYGCEDTEVRRTVTPVYRGTQLISITIGYGKKAIKFKDFMLHANVGRLGNVVKTFGLKGGFSKYVMSLL